MPNLITALPPQTSRPDYSDVIEALDLVRVLADYEPCVIGTPPLGIAIASSDIDIACSASDLLIFVTDVSQAYEHYERFEVTHDVTNGFPSVRIEFNTMAWRVELFCQSVPVAEQWGVRHFNIERRLLRLAPALQREVILLKEQGLKTEPAFAQRLRLEGDPYEAVVKLEGRSDEELLQLISNRQEY